MPKKKVKKFRGSRTHGKGQNDRNRGAGCRGGRGNAGRHKHKYIKFIKLAKMGLYQFGKYGFTRPVEVTQRYGMINRLKKTLRALKAEGKLDDYTYKFLYSRPDLNVSDLDEIIDRLVEFGLAEKKDDKYFVDLAQLGYTKLLGSGIVTKKIEVKVESATPKAVEKIESVGGKVITEV
ncbi:uL15m family ribosomal protein [Archaeoglobus sp.]